MLPVLVLLDGSGAGSQRQRAKQHHGYGIRVGSRLKWCCFDSRALGFGLPSTNMWSLVLRRGYRILNIQESAGELLPVVLRPLLIG